MKQIRSYFCGELRADTSDGKVFIIGRALSYNSRSENLGPPWMPIYEELLPGCLDEVDDSEAVHCIDHDNARLLGKVSSGTTQLSVDGRGLTYRSEAPNTTWTRDLLELIKRGDAQFSSFAFTLDEGDPDAQTYAEIPDPHDASKTCLLRSIAKIQKLYDVSTLTGHPPAYGGNATSAGLSDRFSSMPAEYRARLSREQSDIDDTPDADTVEDVDCNCDCQACTIDGDCENCDPETCGDPENCRCQEATRSLPGDRGDVAAVVDELNHLALEQAMEEPIM